MTVGSYLQHTVSKGPFEEVMFDGATSYARIQGGRGGHPRPGKVQKKLAWLEVVR